MITAGELFGIWDTFFFAPQPNATIAVFRIAFGLLLVVNSLLLFVDAQRWYSPDGVYAKPFFDTHLKSRRFTLLSFLPANKGSIYIVLAVNAVASLFLMIGFITGVAAFVAFLTLTSLSNRNPLISHGGDVILRIMALLLVFSPAGAMLSIDRYLAMSASDDLWTVTSSSQWCLRLMQLQICIIYLRAFLSKSGKQEWIEGSALYYTSQLRTFQRFPGGQLFRFGVIRRAATWGTLLIQFSLCTLIWIDEFRYPVVIAGVLFHLAIEYLMNVQLFGWIMIVCLVLFVPPGDMAWLLAQL